MSNESIKKMLDALRICPGHPCILGRLIVYISGRLWLKTSEKFHQLFCARDRFHHYPRELKDAARGICTPLSCSETGFKDLVSTGWEPGDGLTLDSWKIPLATYSFKFSELNWNKKEKDIEDVFALHRFAWLLRWVSQCPQKDALSVADGAILDWIKNCPPGKNLSFWETYSVSERVVNWLLYLCATKKFSQMDQKSLEKIGNSLCLQLEYIVKNLEFYGRAFNNHILNNARALYIGGMLLNLPRTADLGKIIFKQYIPELIDSQGALIEGSSHYQLLLTRTMAEVLWVAEKLRDVAFASFLAEIFSRMMACCFYIGDTLKQVDYFPRVGDISPDYPLSWFYPDPGVAGVKGSWWGLWGEDSMDFYLKSRSLEKACSKTMLKEWKWIRISGSELKALVYTPVNFNVYPASHGHLDYGSFLLYDGKGPVWVDRGRFSYGADKMSDYGFSPRAHNLTLINGQPLIPDSRGVRAILNHSFITQRKIRISDNKSEKIIQWQTSAVSRFGKGLMWNREVVIGTRGVSSLEVIENPFQKKVTIESFIHFLSGWTVQAESDTSFLVRNGSRGYCLDIDISKDADRTIKICEAPLDASDGWHFPEYGTKLPSLTFCLMFQTDHPFNLKYTLSPI